jgi:membrane-associated phospholipid phosphatase
VTYSIRPSRREVLHLAAGSLVFGLAGGAARAAAPARKRGRGRANPALDPTAGNWRTWLIPGPTAVLPPPPPPTKSALTRAEIAELLALKAQRSAGTNAIVEFWDPQGGVLNWTNALLAKIVQRSLNPILAARALALLHTAMFDAVVGAWHSKWTYKRPAPVRVKASVQPLTEVASTLPSYASEHAAIAAAAATVLGYLFPAETVTLHGVTSTFDAFANEAAASRLWGGANYRSDIEAGLLIGQAVGWHAVERGETDGSKASWDTGTQPGRPGTDPPYWVPTAPGNVFPPLLPLTGLWNPWVLESGSQFRPGPPPALTGGYPSAAFLAECQEVKDSATGVGANQQIAVFWADGTGSATPPGHWTQFTRDHVAAAELSAPRAARALAYQGVAVADAAISCWDAKFHYWVQRPITAIRTLAGQPFHDPAWVSPVTTPPFPAYSSGHSTFSGASATLLEHFFPNGKVSDAFGSLVSFEAASEQAALSRLYGGIHYRSDNEAGLTAGRSIGQLLRQRALTDGA